MAEMYQIKYKNKNKNKTAMKNEETEDINRRNMTENKINFPIITKSGKSFYPTENKCPICGADRTKLNSKFFVLNGGALKKINKDYSTMSDDLEGFLSLSYHSGELSRGNSTDIEIVELSQSGQFDIYFCSIECLQIFFNQIVERIKEKCGFELEKKK
jgi:hypothetical protein